MRRGKLTLESSDLDISIEHLVAMILDENMALLIFAEVGDILEFTADFLYQPDNRE